MHQTYYAKTIDYLLCQYYSKLSFFKMLPQVITNHRSYFHYHKSNSLTSLVFTDHSHEHNPHM